MTCASAQPALAIEFTLAGLRIESEMNRDKGPWVRRRRFTTQRKAVAMYWCKERVAHPFTARQIVNSTGPIAVTLTRIAPRELDGHDNLRTGFKGIVDQLALILRVDDGNERVTWNYKQERGGVKEYAARIRIEVAP